MGKRLSTEEINNINGLIALGKVRREISGITGHPIGTIAHYITRYNKEHKQSDIDNFSVGLAPVNSLDNFINTLQELINDYKELKKQKEEFSKEKEVFKQQMNKWKQIAGKLNEDIGKLSSDK